MQREYLIDMEWQESIEVLVLLFVVMHQLVEFIFAEIVIFLNNLTTGMDSRATRCWLRMLETKAVGDNIGMLVMTHVTKI